MNNSSKTNIYQLYKHQYGTQNLAGFSAIRSTKTWIIFHPFVFVDLLRCRRPVHVPSWVSVQLIEDCLLTELKHQMEASLPPVDLQQIDQIHMFQLLQAQQRTTKMKHSIMFWNFLC